VTYLYAGLGMAMLTAIMAMFEMATGITNQQIMSRPPEDPYYDSGAQAIDQAALRLAAEPSPKGLQGWSMTTTSALCDEVNRLVRENPDLYASLAGYSFAPSVQPETRLASGCETAVVISGSGVHRLTLAPTESRQYSVFSCVTKQAYCFHESA
jgi:hypothetical protein